MKKRVDDLKKAVKIQESLEGLNMAYGVQQALVLAMSREMLNVDKKRQS